MKKHLILLVAIAFHASLAVAGQPISQADCIRGISDTGSSVVPDFVRIQHDGNRYTLTTYVNGFGSVIKNQMASCEGYGSGMSEFVSCIAQEGGQAALLEPQTGGFQLTIAQGLAIPRVISLEECFITH